jgi:glycosyltransferase involved in cell wall biosynthesis
MKPLVSIIIPCYNSELWIADSIESCLNQTYSHIEIIIVNDGSTDKSVNIINAFVEKFPEKISVISKTNGGSSSARNLAIKYSKGDYFIFLDSDDLLEIDAVERFLDTINTQKVDIAVGDWMNFANNNYWNTEYIKSAPFYADDYLASLLKQPPVISSFMVKRNQQNWNEDMHVWEVFNYLFSLLSKGYFVGFVNKAVVKIRQHQTPNRISVKYNHFDPFITGNVFADYKNELFKLNKMTYARYEVLDQAILANSYSLLRCGEVEKCHQLNQYISWDKINRYSWFKLTGLSGFAWLFGYKLGMSIFVNLNKIMGRI